MSEEISASMNAAAVNVPAVDTISAAQPASATRTASWLRGSGMVLAGSALVAVCAHLALPLYFTPVPLSLAPFAVLVLGLLLRPSLAAATLGVVPNAPDTAAAERPIPRPPSGILSDGRIPWFGPGPLPKAAIYPGNFPPPQRPQLGV